MGRSTGGANGPRGPLYPIPATMLVIGAKYISLHVNHEEYGTRPSGMAGLD